MNRLIIIGNGLTLMQTEFANDFFVEIRNKL